MASVTRICEICGKEYPYCATNAFDKFRWQDVACCPEHGAEFFAKVLAIREAEREARNNKKEDTSSVEVLDKSVDDTDKCECMKDIFCDAGDDGDDEDWDEYEIDKFDDDEDDEDDDFYFDEEYDDGDDA